MSKATAINHANKPKRKAIPHDDKEMDESIISSSSASNKRSKKAPKAAISETPDDVPMDHDDDDDDALPPVPPPNRPRASNPFLALFWDLSSTETSVRAVALSNLITALLNQQSDLTSIVGSGSGASKKNKLTAVTDTSDVVPDDGHPHIAAKVYYSIKRLIRGLCSSRDGARAGFSDALVEILRRMPVITTADVVDAMDISLKLPDGPTREERTDFKIGHSMTVTILNAANRLSELPHDRITTHLQELIEYQTSHPVRPYSTAAIIALINIVDFESFHSQVESQLLQVFDSPQNESKSESTSNAPIELDSLTPDQLSILLALQRRYKRSKQVFPHDSMFAVSARRPFHIRALPQFTQCLIQTIRALPTLHVLWTQTFDTLLKSSDDDKNSKSRVQWHQVWRSVVENGLIMKATGSTVAQHRHLALLVLDHLVHRFRESPHNISLLLTPNVMKILSAALNDATHIYHPAAEQVRASLVAVAESNGALLMPIIAALNKSNAAFDRLSRTKTVETLIDQIKADESRMRQYVVHLSQMMNQADGSEDGVSTDEHRQWILDQMYKLSKYARGMPNILRLVVEFFIFHGYFQSSTEPAATHQPKTTARKSKKHAREDLATSNTIPLDNEICSLITSALSDSVVEFTRSRFLTLLADQMKASKSRSVQSKTDQSLSKDVIAAEDDVKDNSTDLVVTCHHIFDQLTSSGWQQLIPLEEEETSVRRDTLTLVEKISADISTDESAMDTSSLDKAQILNRRQRIQRRSIIRTLLLYLAIAQWTDVETSTELLDDVAIAYRRVFDAQPHLDKTAKKKAKTNVDEAADDEPAYIEVLMDVVLSLLVKPTSLYRDIGKQVFQNFCSNLNETALLQLADVLQRRPSSNADGEDDDDEFAPIDIAPTEQDGDDSIPADSETLRNKKRKADDDEGKSPSKRTKRSSSVGEDDDEDSIDEEIGLNTLTSLLDSDLTEAEIAAIEGSRIDEYDHHLANIIRLRKTKSTDERDAKQQIEQFQLRVIDLIELFLHRHSDSPLTLALYLPLIACADQNKRSKNGAITNRIASLVRKSLCKGKHPVADDQTSLSDAPSSKKLKLKRAAATEMAEVSSSASPSALVPRTNVHSTMTAVMEYARRSSDNLIVSLCGDMILALSRASNSPDHVKFVAELYRTALIRYMTARRTHLNNKMFVDVINRYPQIGARWIKDLINMCTMPSDAANVTAVPTVASLDKPAAKLKSKSALAPSRTGPFVVNAFRRNECFSLIQLLYSRRQSISPADESASLLTSAVELVIKLIENNMSAALLPMEQRVQIEKAITEAAKQTAANERLNKSKANGNGSDDDEEEAEENDAAVGESDAVDVSKLSAADREKYRLKMKRKRRLQRKAEAKKRAEMNDVTQTHKQDLDVDELSPAVEKALDKRTALHIKEYIRLVTAVVKSQNTTDGFSSLPTSFKDALSALPAKYVTPSQHLIRNLLNAANIDESEVKLNISEPAPQLNGGQKTRKSEAKSKTSDKKFTNKQAKAKPSAAAAAAKSDEPSKSKHRNINSYRTSAGDSTSSKRSTPKNAHSNKKDKSKRNGSDKSSKKSRRALAAVSKAPSKKRTSSIKIAYKKKGKGKSS